MNLALTRRLISIVAVSILMLGGLAPIGGAAQEAPPTVIVDPQPPIEGWSDIGNGCWSYVLDGVETTIACFDPATNCYSETTVATGDIWWQCTDPTTGCITDSTGYSDCGDPTTGAIGWYTTADGCIAYWDGTVDTQVTCYDAATNCTTVDYSDGSSWWQCTDPTTGCTTDSTGYSDCGDPTTGAIGWYTNVDGCTAYWDGAQDAIVYCTDAAAGCWSQAYADGTSIWQCIDPTTGCVTDYSGYDSCAVTTPGEWTDLGNGCQDYVENGVVLISSCTDAATGCYSETYADGSGWWYCSDPVSGCYADSYGNSTCGDPTTGAVGWYTNADGCAAYWDGAQDAVVYCSDAETGCWSQSYADGTSIWQCTDPTSGCVTDYSGFDSCADTGSGDTTVGIWVDRGDGCQDYIENDLVLISTCTDAATGCYYEFYPGNFGWWYCVDPVTGCYIDSYGNGTCGDPTTGAVGWYSSAEGCWAYWDGVQDAISYCTVEADGCSTTTYSDGTVTWQCTDPVSGCVSDNSGNVACPVADVGCVVTDDGLVACPSRGGALPVDEPVAVELPTGEMVQRGAFPTIADIVDGGVVAITGGDVSDAEADAGSVGPFEDGLRTFAGDDWYVTPRT